QAHPAVDPDLGAVADRDAGRLLAPVLKCEQAQVGHVRDRLGRLGGGPDSEDAAGFPKLVRTRLHGSDDTASQAWGRPVGRASIERASAREERSEVAIAAARPGVRMAG